MFNPNKFKLLLFKIAKFLSIKVWSITFFGDISGCCSFSDSSTTSPVRSNSFLWRKLLAKKVPFELSKTDDEVLVLPVYALLSSILIKPL